MKSMRSAFPAQFHNIWHLRTMGGHRQTSLHEGLNVFNGINGQQLIFWPFYGKRLISRRYG